MHTSAFFKLFPPPKFLEMPYAGLDISDTAAHCLLYRHTPRGLTLDRYSVKAIPKGVIESGIIQNESTLVSVLASLSSELKVTYVKASLPEERMYLFKTEVPAGRPAEIHENIELRIEENVPLSPADAVFYFDIIRDGTPHDRLPASVSVAPRKLVESYRDAIEKAGLVPMSFEVVPKSLSHAIVPNSDLGTKLIIYCMSGKTGLYIVGGGAVLFTSTVSWSFPADAVAAKADIASLETEIGKVFAYWAERGPAGADIKEIVLSGSRAPEIAEPLGRSGRLPPARVANVWTNAFSLDHYVPPLSRDESMDYAVAAGLALPAGY